jgi:lipopolysaccharide export LptBFGC system permease protein LptF
VTVAAPEPASAIQTFGFRALLASFLRGAYVRDFFRGVAIQTVMVVTLIEAIFLAERFTPVFREAVRHDADLFGIAFILLCTSPEVFDLALAVAILMAAYSVLMKMRENRELLVLFASGLGPYQLSTLVLVVALAGQVIGLAGSGLVDPLSRYAQRAILFSSELRSLKKGVAKGEFYYFPSYVAYAMDHVQGGRPPPGEVPVIDARAQAAPHDRTLFIYQQIGPRTSRVVTAAQARLDGPDRDGRIILNLNDFTSHTFADARPMPGPGDGTMPSIRPDPLKSAKGVKDLPPINMKVRDMSQLMMVDQLLPFGGRGNARPEEQTLFEQLAVPEVRPEARTAQMRLLAERWARSLLSFLAPLMALLGVCFTTRRTNWLALPFACLALMSVNLLSEWIITTLAPATVAGALLPPFLLALGVAWLVMTLVIWQHPGLVKPQLGRS